MSVDEPSADGFARGGAAVSVTISDYSDWLHAIGDEPTARAYITYRADRSGELRDLEVIRKPAAYYRSELGATVATNYAASFGERGEPIARRSHWYAVEIGPVDDWHSVARLLWRMSADPETIEVAKW